jgi:uncharacterized membrane protein (UPF0136 family)
MKQKTAFEFLKKTSLEKIVAGIVFFLRAGVSAVSGCSSTFAGALFLCAKTCDCKNRNAILEVVRAVSNVHVW